MLLAASRAREDARARMREPQAEQEPGLDPAAMNQSMQTAPAAAPINIWGIAI